ncbi:galactokinase [Candidatus Halobonum tyrrellensis]|uniref:Galactokinase n=1 Tax=Candidatus Halobonum tyrrellensis G22 TaxID=1324957 RepID=V4HHP2_9EURY|nr:galactokinase [Candidatus Halobonum tyrrellensis]ESP87419.1 galactokinase [Candidatus Halobonum tyrrellensis G22]
MTTHDDGRAVAETFEARYGAEPAVRSRAPGRVNLVGGHVDYSGGVVLPVAIDRTTVVAARPRDDGVVRAYSARMDESVEASVGDAVDGWAAYVVGTATTLSDEVDRPVGADLAVGGDMILGAGVSSSAALEVAVAGALDSVHELGLSRETLADVCWRAENQEVGMSCGIMDQFASALGRAGHALRIDCRSRDVETIPFDTGTASLLLVDTNVKHELIDSGYNERVRECHEATAILDAETGKRVRSLRDVTPEDVEANREHLDPPLDRRARHVTTEIRRVKEAAEALAADDVERVGALVRESHRSLTDDYEVSCAELDTVVDILDDCEGVYGARMVGGGWGGSVVALVAPGTATRVGERVADEYRAATDIDPGVYAFDIGDGLTVETLSG